MPVKVIHLISSLRRGGRERQLAGILKYENQPCLSKAIVFNRTQNSYEQEYNLSASLIYLQSKNSFKRLVEILAILKREKPDVIWSWGGFEATFGLILSFITPVRHINGSIRHGIVLMNTKQIWRLIILHLSRHIVANSRAGLKANGLKRGLVMYNGLDEQFFRPIDKEQFLLQNPDIKKIKDYGAPILISVANLIPYKDYITVLKALTKVKAEGEGFYYLIAGEGPDRAVIENLINDNNLADNVSILGRRQDIRELLTISDIFIHSSKGEGCSNAILEAMAAGLPIIASDTGGTREIVSDKNGHLFRFKDIEELTDILIRCLNDMKGVETMGKASFEIASRDFTMVKMMNDYNRFVKDLATK